MWNTEAWISLSGALEEIAYPGPDSNPRRVTVPEGIEEEQTFEAVVYPSASMEEKAEIPEGREAWSDHRLHTEKSLHGQAVHPDTEFSSRT